MAAVYGHYEVMEVIVGMYYSNENEHEPGTLHGDIIDEPIYTGETPLMLAIKSNFYNCATKMIRILGADPFRKDHSGNSGMLMAIEKIPPLAASVLDAKKSEKMSTVDGRKKHVSFDFSNLDEVDGYLKSNQVGDSSVAVSKPKLKHFRTPLQEIIRCGSQQLITHPVVVALLELKWAGFARRDVMQESGSHIAFTICWVIATALPEEHGKTVALWVALAAGVVNALLWHSTKYQRFQIVMSITATTFLLILGYQDIQDANDKTRINKSANYFSAWVSVYFWFRILDIASVIRFFGVITKAAKDMLADVIRFGVIFLVVILGFSQAFYLVIGDFNYAIALSGNSTSGNSTALGVGNHSMDMATRILRTVSNSNDAPQDLSLGASATQRCLPSFL